MSIQAIVHASDTTELYNVVKTKNVVTLQTNVLLAYWKTENHLLWVHLQEYINEEWKHSKKVKVKSKTFWSV